VGAAIARELAVRGASVGITYHRNSDAADAIVGAISGAGGSALAVRAVAEEREGWPGVAAQVESEFGPIDLLVSNAGIASRGRSVADSDAAEFDRLMNVHAFGPLSLIRHLLPSMRRSERSDIVVISSALVSSAPPYSAPYTMAKAAMESACRVMAFEEREHGVRVNIVAPGLVDTDMGAKLVAAGDSTSGAMAAVAARSPFGRVCAPEDVAVVVSSLVGPAGGYVTGQRVCVDGGGAAPTTH
jgi:NAD(P)-dependent dehydrogenase (short-subunit alcohol dehydrogenase family)